MTDHTAIIRRDAKGRPDDVVISGTGEFTFRLERTGKDSWWLAIYLPSKHGHGLQDRVAFWLSRDGKRVDVNHVEDQIGCTDDCRPEPTDEEIMAEDGEQPWPPPETDDPFDPEAAVVAEVIRLNPPVDAPGRP